MQLQFESSSEMMSVTDITKKVKRLLERAPTLQNVRVRGQISNYSHSSTGHRYFSLKDADSKIECALFRNNASGISFVPSDGDDVVVAGKISVYAKYGTYQINVETVKPMGTGAMERAFEQLKQKLTDEGLFDDKHKVPLPKFPHKIGVITSPTGRAIGDIEKTLKKRYPLAELWLYPTSVQGERAPGQIVEGIEYMNRHSQKADVPIDVLIVARGGGSIEGLWAYNEEAVARAISRSKIPVVSAIAHEGDELISDLVADCRASTPTASIMDSVPDKQELLGKLNDSSMRLRNAVNSKRRQLQTQVTEAERRLSPIRQKEKRKQLEQTLDTLETAFKVTIERRLEEQHRLLQNLEERLNALSPLATLERGYSISRKPDGEILTRAEQADVGENIEIRLSEGTLHCVVKRRTL